MKKLITPLVHLPFLIPILAIAMGSIELMARRFDFLPDYIRAFEVPYVFLTLGIIVIFSSLLFWLANRLMQFLDKLANPGIYDHFRQSIFFYLITACILASWIFNGFTGGEDDVYFVTMVTISVVAITLNCIFLIRKRKTTLT